MLPKDNAAMKQPPATPSAGRSRRCPAALDRAGGSRITTLLFFLLIAAAIYAGYGYLPPWMAYRAMKDQMQEQARTMTVVPDEEIVDRLYAVAKEWSLPITKDDIHVQRTESQIFISTRWEVTVTLFGGRYEHRLVFAPSVQELLLPVNR